MRRYHLSSLVMQVDQYPGNELRSLHRGKGLRRYWVHDLEHAQKLPSSNHSQHHSACGITPAEKSRQNNSAFQKILCFWTGRIRKNPYCLQSQRSQQTFQDHRQHQCSQSVLEESKRLYDGRKYIQSWKWQCRYPRISKGQLHKRQSARPYHWTWRLWSWVNLNQEKWGQGSKAKKKQYLKLGRTASHSIRNQPRKFVPLRPKCLIKQWKSRNWTFISSGRA